MFSRKKKVAVTLGLFALIFFVFLIPSSFSFALADPGLVPCGLDPGLNDPCTLCDAVQLVKNIIRFVIMDLAAPVATGLIAWAGINLIIFASNPGERDKAKQLLLDILVGFLWILMAWFVVELIITTLVKNNPTGTGSWFILDCSLDVNNRGPVNMDISPYAGVTARPIADLSADRLHDPEARAKLEAVNNIRIVSTGGCSDQNNRTCTSGEGAKRDTIDGIVNLAQACSSSSCILKVSGLAETGHGSGHTSGDKFDASLDNSTFNQYMSGLLGYKNVTEVPKDTIIQAKLNGFCYDTQYETAGGVKPHWDVKVSKCN